MAKYKATKNTTTIRKGDTLTKDQYGNCYLGHGDYPFGLRIKKSAFEKSNPKQLNK